MGLRGLNWQRAQLPLASGVHTKAHPFALDAPMLTVCRDAQFTQTGALQTRKPYATLGTNILGGGTISNPRRLVANGNELVLFTADTIYSWDSRDSAWAPRGTHYAVAPTEQTVFATADDQRDCDRAELSGTVVYVWSNGSNCYVAAADKTTGATICVPQLIALATRPRLVTTTTRIILFYVNNGIALSAIAIDPANVVTSLGAGPTSVVANPTFNSYYDVTRVIGADTVVGASRNATTTAYTVFTVTAGMTVTTASKARTCDGPIAVSSTPDGTKVQIARGNGNNIQGDLLTINGSFTDVFTGQALGSTDTTGPDHIAAAHRSVLTSGQYRCYVFWSDSQNAGGGTNYRIKSNWADTANTLGSQAAIVRGLGIASRAFDYNGNIYLWFAFGNNAGFTGDGVGASVGQFQNAYFLYRGDDFPSLCAKAVYNSGAGLNTTLGHLPGVALTSGSTTFSVCLGVRRRITLGPGTATGFTALSTGSAMRAPRDVTFTFDSNDARRAVRLGRTLYIAGGEVLQYDGAGIFEVGWHTAPYYFDAFRAAGGNLATGTYAYKQTYRWYNSQYEIDRSTSASIGTVTIASGPQQFTTSTWYPCTATHKASTAAGAPPLPAIENWRTAVNPTAGAPFYLVTAIDPSVTSNPNRYVANDPTLALNATFIDQAADSSITSLQINPETGALLSTLAPPAASIIAADANRIFLAGVPGDPNRVWYSKLRADGEVAGFNDALTINVPLAGGAITGLAFLNETLIVFRQSAIYALPGDGYANDGSGQNYGPAKVISQELGAVNADAIAFEPTLGLMFKSNKGWWLLDRSWGLRYIGGPVNAFDSDTVLAVNTVESQNQVRCLTNNRMLVYSYLVDQWAEWTVSNGAHAAIISSSHYVVDATNGPMQEQSTYAAASYGMDIETAWIKMDDLQGFARIRRLTVLGEYRSAHTLRIRIARNYQGDGAGSWSWFDDVNWTATPATVGSALQVQHGPTKQQGEAFKVRLTITPSGNGDCIALVGLAFELGMLPDLYKRLPVAQKA